MNEFNGFFYAHKMIFKIIMVLFSISVLENQQVLRMWCNFNLFEINQSISCKYPYRETCTYRKEKKKNQIIILLIIMKINFWHFTKNRVKKLHWEEIFLLFRYNCSLLEFFLSIFHLLLPRMLSFIFLQIFTRLFLVLNNCDKNSSIQKSRTVTNITTCSPLTQIYWLEKKN